MFIGFSSRCKLLNFKNVLFSLQVWQVLRLYEFIRIPLAPFFVMSRVVTTIGQNLHVSKNGKISFRSYMITTSQLHGHVVTLVCRTGSDREIRTLCRSPPPPLSNARRPSASNPTASRTANKTAGGQQTGRRDGDWGEWREPGEQ